MSRLETALSFSDLEAFWSELNRLSMLEYDGAFCAGLRLRAQLTHQLSFSTACQIASPLTGGR